jgi:hypothetical protein
VIRRNANTVAKPTRKPVKEPGPIETARPSKRFTVNPLEASNVLMVGISDLAWDPCA